MHAGEIDGCRLSVRRGMLGAVCGRYAASAGAEEVVEAFGVEADLTGGALRPTWNAAPTQRRAVVVARPREGGDGDGAREGGGDRDGGAGSGEDAGAVGARRELRLLTWGLVPSWSRDATGGARMINARAETVLERPAFRRAAASRRCLVPADGWYEWRSAPPGDDTAGAAGAAAAAAAAGSAGSGRARKQPYFTTLADGGQLALAGLYEFWRRRDAPRATGGEGEGAEEWLVTFAVLTRDAEPGLDAVHDRMPLVLPPGMWEEWLDPATTAPGQVAAMLDAATSLPPGRFTAVPVSSRVGSVRQDDPGLVEPVGPPLEL